MRPGRRAPTALPAIFARVAIVVARARYRGNRDAYSRRSEPNRRELGGGAYEKRIRESTTDLTYESEPRELYEEDSEPLSNGEDEHTKEK